MEERELAGGNASGIVVRKGNTVRKPATAATKVVRRYLQYLEARDLRVPRHFGLDSFGRQKLEFVDGVLAMDRPRLARAELGRVGQMVRELHDASAGFIWDAGDEFDSPIPAPGQELMCHNDLAPWNLVVGEADWVFIDWDAAAPSTRLWDLAYAAQSFAVNNPEAPPDAAAGDLQAFLRGYGPDDALRRELVPAMIERVAAMYQLLRSSHEAGIEPWGSMFSTGHGEHWAAVHRYLLEHRRLLNASD